MVDETSAHTKARKPKRRSFLKIDADYNRGGKPGFVLENDDVIIRYLWRTIDPRYSEFPEKPRFLFDKKLGRPPRDIEGYVRHWLISDKLKVVFEAVDRDAFAFASCDVRLPDGTAGPHRWLCTVTRVLDALDDDASRVTKGHDQHGNIC